jgi:hypothetical protein
VEAMLTSLAMTSEAQLVEESRSDRPWDDRQAKLLVLSIAKLNQSSSTFSSLSSK